MTKSRLIFIPQLPVSMRYTEWWIKEFPKKLFKYFSEIIIIGEKYLLEKKESSSLLDNDEVFFNLNDSLFFENKQIEEYIDLELKDDDILLLADISFPGLFSSILYHKRPKKCFTICHGTSKNNFDIFQKDRSSKWQVESGYAELFDGIFVGSEYHKHKLKWQNVKVIGMPNPPMNYDYPIKDKTIDILSVSRKTYQKVDDKLESIVEEEFGEIRRDVYSTWNEYFNALSFSKVLLVTAREETYGYQIIDCFKYGNGCVPLAPKCLSYVELLENKYLYSRNKPEELIAKIRNVLSGDSKPFSVYDLMFNYYDYYDDYYEKLMIEILN